MDGSLGLQHLCSTSAFLATLNLFSILGYHKIQFMAICFTYENTEYRSWYVFTLDFNIMANNESSGFEEVNRDLMKPGRQRQPERHLIVGNTSISSIRYY